MSISCNNCGTRLTEDSRFCLSCGTAVAESRSIDKPDQLSRGPSKKLLIWISVPTGLLSITGIVLVILLSSDAPIRLMRSPEETFHTFQNALRSGEYETVYDLVTESERSEMDRMFREVKRESASSGMQKTLRDLNVDIERISSARELFGIIIKHERNMNANADRRLTAYQEAKIERVENGIVFFQSGGESGRVKMEWENGFWHINLKTITRMEEVLTSRLGSTEKSAIGFCRNMIQVQALWKGNDIDRNAVSDYWVADVSGMYRIEKLPVGSGMPVDSLLNIAEARADANPFHPEGGIYYASGSYVTNLLPTVPTLFPQNQPPRAKAGYFFRALERDENGDPYIQDVGVDGARMKATNIHRFGFVAYPEVFASTGIHTFIVNQSGNIWKKDTGGAIITSFPKNPAAERWSLVD